MLPQRKVQRVTPTYPMQVSNVDLSPKPFGIRNNFYSCEGLLKNMKISCNKDRKGKKSKVLCPTWEKEKVEVGI